MGEAVGSSNSPRLPTGAGIIRFGNFEADSRSGEVRRGGIRVKLSCQPLDVLVALLEKPAAKDNSGSSKRTPAAERASRS